MIIAWLLLDNYGFFPLIYVFLNCLVDQIGRGLGQSAHCWNCNLFKPFGELIFVRDASRMRLGVNQSSVFRISVLYWVVVVASWPIRRRRCSIRWWRRCIRWRWCPVTRWRGPIRRSCCTIHLVVSSRVTATMAWKEKGKSKKEKATKKQGWQQVHCDVTAGKDLSACIQKPLLCLWALHQFHKMIKEGTWKSHFVVVAL